MAAGAGVAERLTVILAGLGYELVDVEFARDGTLRVFMDKPAGIAVEDCVLVSNHLSRVLPVENIDYERLEVSSPGLDRPLKKVADFQRFAGEVARFRLRLPIEGNMRRFDAQIVAVDAEHVTVLREGKTLVVALSNIEKARLVPVF